MEGKMKKNITKYGEFIPTYYEWIGLEKQKEVVERLEKISKKKEK